MNMEFSYLKNGKITYSKGTEIEVYTDVLQGSGLGPILWNIKYDEVLRIPLMGSDEERQANINRNDTIQKWKGRWNENKERGQRPY